MPQTKPIQFVVDPLTPDLSCRSRECDLPHPLRYHAFPYAYSKWTLPTAERGSMSLLMSRARGWDRYRLQCACAVRTPAPSSSALRVDRLQGKRMDFEIGGLFSRGGRWFCQVSLRSKVQCFIIGDTLFQWIKFNFFSLYAI